MDIISRLNNAVEYMEANLLGDINYEEVARAACCSSYNFHRMFLFVTDVTPTEYVRRRRLTLAALELQETSAKVIDIAYKYGYEFPSSFARAFYSLHGVSPSSIRNGKVNLKAYPRISFQIKIKGVSELNYRIEKKQAFQVFGVEGLISTIEDEKHYLAPGDLWNTCMSNGTFDQMLVDTGYDETPGLANMCRIHALMNYKKTEQNTWPYMMCAIVGENSQTKGYEVIDIAPTTWAVFPSKKGFAWDEIGNIIEDLNKRIYSEWLPTTDYEKTDGPEFEMYGGTEDGGYIELWIPVKKR